MKAEVLWTMKMVTSHYSCKSSEKTSDLFRLMFPDSEIAASFACGETKSRYLITFGLAPHFSELMLKNVRSSKNYVLLFDESLNHKNQLKQMDFHIRSWEGDVVKTHYLTSEFLGHGRAIDLVEKFKTVLTDFTLNPASLLQISMDGPAVNLKVLDDMDTDLQDNYQVGLLRVGTCGLHVMHNAFRRGCEASQWDLESFLSACYTLFRDSPARREDFINVTESSSLPAKFCAHRWLENKSVASKLIELLPDLKKFVIAAQEKKITLPQNKSFDIVKTGVMSPLIPCRLAFFCFVASKLEPFLEKYQAEQPLLPFMSTDLQDVLKSLLKIFVKREVLDGCTTAQRLVNVDVTNTDHHVHLKAVELGFKTDELVREANKHSSMMEGPINAFRAECKAFVKAIVLKLQEKSPLKFELVRNLSCLNPHLMANKETSKRKMKMTLQCLQTARRLKHEECDQALQEYDMFLDEAVSKLSPSEFNLRTQRLDTWLHSAMANKPQYQMLWAVTQKLLLLSHGQAVVERGFSFNKEVMADNLSQVALKARRVVMDHVHSVGGIENVVLNKPLLHAARGAWKKYDTFLQDERRKKAESEGQQRQKRLGEELGNLRKKLKTCSTEERHLLEEADKLSFQAQEKKSFNLISRSNTLRLLAKDKKDEAEETQQEIHRLEEELKKC